jgi:hypothetical protein
VKHQQAVASILATLLDFDAHERLEVLALVCAAYAQTQGLTLPSWELCRAARGKPSKKPRNPFGPVMGPKVKR